MSVRTAAVWAGAAWAASATPTWGATTSDERTPTAIVIFIADGCGYTTHRATELWSGRAAPYRSGAWREHVLATSPLRTGSKPIAGPEGLAQDPSCEYDGARARDITPIDGAALGYPFRFGGYLWHRQTCPDSANTATSIFTGARTYVGAINVDGNGVALESLAERASSRGLAVGVVSSVPISHATVACAAGAHHADREAYHDIAREMLTSGVCSVIAGAGHPEHDSDGRARATPEFAWISPEDWAALRDGSARTAAGDAWALAEDLEAIRSLAKGATPTRVVMMARAGDTLQEQRDAREDPRHTAPGADPFIPGMPSLAELAMAAWNVVDDDPDGFVLTIEGGAIDWANHENRLGRSVEEVLDFWVSVEAVCARLDAGIDGRDWANTLVIVTSDHDHLLFGPESDRLAFQELEDRGAGVLPGHMWHSDGHSNRLVPLFARGCGAEGLEAIPTREDAGAARKYFHQAALGAWLKALIPGEPRGGANSSFSK